MITETDKAWLAGVIDARGKWHHQPKRSAWCLGLNGDDGVVSAITSMTLAKPTRYYTTEGWRRACAEHCPESHVHVINTYDSAFVRIYGNRLLVVLGNVMPYLRSERDHDAIMDELKRARRFGYIINPLIDLGWAGKRIDTKRCSAEGCDRAAYARGMCGKHYQRWKKHNKQEVSA